MPSEKDDILEFNQYMKSVKIPWIIYADIESLTKKIDGCANNPENSSTTKIGEHISYGYSMSTIRAFDCIENKHTLYRGKKFCEFLREHVKMLPLTKEERGTSRCKNMFIYGKKIPKKVC